MAIPKFFLEGEGPVVRQIIKGGCVRQAVKWSFEVLLIHSLTLVTPAVFIPVSSL